MVTTEYNQCVDAYADRLYRFALKVIGSNDQAHQVVKEAFASLWDQKSSLPLKEVKAFLFSVAYQKLAAHSLVKTEKGSALFEADQNKDQNSLRYLLDKGLDELNAKQKALLILRDYEGSSYDEIASITDIKTEQIKTEIYRARKELKSYLVKARFSA